MYVYGCGCEVIPHHLLWNCSVHPLSALWHGPAGFMRLSGALLSGASGYDEFTSAPSAERVIRPLFVEHGPFRIIGHLVPTWWSIRERIHGTPSPIKLGLHPCFQDLVSSLYGLQTGMHGISCPGWLLRASWGLPRELVR